MKFYYSGGPADPTKINLDDLLNRYRNYDFHFYTHYLSDEGIFIYEKNVLYCEKVKDNKIETKKIVDFEIIIDYSDVYTDFFSNLIIAYLYLLSILKIFYTYLIL